MNKFAFMIHPIDINDFFRKFPLAQKLPSNVVERMTRFVPPLYVSQITGVESPYAATEGMFVACPLTSKQIMELPESYVLHKIIKAGKYAEKHGAKILGLGAMTSVVGDAGVTIAKNLNIAVTTGNSYTVYTALEGVKKAAQSVGVDWRQAEILIIGATGSIGSICARMLARESRCLTLAARDDAKLERLAQKIYDEQGLTVKTTTSISQALKKADIVLGVSGAVTEIIDAGDLKVGAVVCDVARPRSISKSVAETRDDVLVIEGGLIEIPGDVNFNFNFGYPPKLALACMAETMILALENMYENYTLGRDLTMEQVENIGKLGEKHGFRLAGFRSFERPVPEDYILQVKALRLAESAAVV